MYQNEDKLVEIKTGKIYTFDYYKDYENEYVNFTWIQIKNKYYDYINGRISIFEDKYHYHHINEYISLSEIRKQKLKKLKKN